MSNADDSAWDRKKAALRKWLDELPTKEPPGLSDALYSIDQMGMFIDGIDSMSREQAIQVWGLVERLRTEEFPDELCM